MSMALDASCLETIFKIDKNFYVPNELIVKFKKGTSTGRAGSIAMSVGASRVLDLFSKKTGIQPLLKHVKLQENISTEEAIADFKKNPEVEYAQPNYIYKTLITIPNDPDFNSQWGLYNTGQSINGISGSAGADVDAPHVWDMVTDCSSVIVAVVDTGVNYDQRDLTPNMWNGGASYPRHGYNFIDGTDDPMDMHGHGTHVAGIIGAGGNDDIGICGVCWKIQLMAVRVLDATGSGTTASVVSGINFAVANGAHIINLSLGVDTDDGALKSSIQGARDAGVIVVAAAGNSGSSNFLYPAAYTLDYDNVISVGATDQRGRLAPFSNYSPSWVSIAAPGTNVLSTWPGQSVTTRENFSDWIKEANWGTSTYIQQNGYGSSDGITLLTDPADFGYSNYQPNQNNAAYKPFDLGIYGAASAIVRFYCSFDIIFGDYLYFILDPTGVRPDIETKSSIVYGIFNGDSEGYLISSEVDFTRHITRQPSLGFLFKSGYNIAGAGSAIGLFDTTRLYLNPTACRYLAGTSMATPHVTGAAALCIAQYIDKYGSYSCQVNYRSIINAILNDDSASPDLAGKISNGRRLNANLAVQKI